MIKDQIPFLLIICCFIPFIGYSQDYDINITSGYNPVSTDVNERVYELRFRTVLTDTSSLETSVLSMVNDSFKIEPKYNFGIGIGQRFTVTDKIDIRFQLGGPFPLGDLLTAAKIGQGGHFSDSLLK